MFDEVAGAYREDRPLAFFDGQGEVVEARVSLSGQEMAAMICHVGSCAGTHAPVSADALQHLWISRDAGRTWGDLGQVPASTPLAGDSSLFGEESSPPSGTGYGRTIAWRSLAQGYYLFAIADQEGAVQRVYGSEEPLGDWQRGVSITGDLVVWWEETYVDGLTTLAGAQMVDLATATIHKVAGLSLPLGFDPEGDPEQDEFYYGLTAARPAPSIAYTPLTLGEPRELPAGVALYYYTALRCTLCKPLPLDVRRAVFDEGAGELRQDRPLAFFDEGIDFFDYSGLDYGTQKVTSFGVSRSGQTLAVTLCHVGRCQVEPVGGVYPTVDWDLRLWVSDDGGRNWEDRGLLLPETAIVDVTDEDVLLRTRNFWRYADRKYTGNGREHMRMRLEPLGLNALEGREHWFRWAVSGAEHVPSNTEPTPPSGGRVDWRQALVLPGGSVAWSAEAEGVYLLAIAGEEGTVEHILGSEKPLWGLPSVHDLVLSPVTLPSLYLLSVVESGEVRRSMLLDLATSIIHPIGGLPQDDRWSNAASVFLGARPAPD